jgi:hypothetical protein
VIEAMLKMRKTSIQALEKAHEGAQRSGVTVE